MIYYEKKKRISVYFRFDSMSSTLEDEKDHLSLCNRIMPGIYVRSLLIYDYYIVNLRDGP